MFKSYEVYKMPIFSRFIAVYQCECSYYNDTWKNRHEIRFMCPVHHLSVRKIESETVFGHRPLHSSTYKYRTLEMS